MDADLGRAGLERVEVHRLMTIPGVDATVALAIIAAVGDFSRFASPDRLVSYMGLNPRVRQSGGEPASHGRITKQGLAHARGMLSRRPGSPPRSRARFGRSTSGSGPDVERRSPWWRPPESSPCCAGISS